MKYLIQTMNKEGTIVFADIVDSPKEIRQVIDIDSRQAIRFKGDVFVYHDKLGDSIVTCISDERAQVLKAANKFPCNYEVFLVKAAPEKTSVKAVLREGEDAHINGFGDILPNSELDFEYDDNGEFYIVIHGQKYEEASTAFNFITVNY